MRKTLVATIATVIFLVVLIPFVSSNPDGLEKVAITYGGQDIKAYGTESWWIILSFQSEINTSKPCLQAYWAL
jgi:hypothetical protein